VNEERDVTSGSGSGEARRRAFFRETRSYTPYVAAKLDDAVVFVKTADDGVSRTVFLRGSRGDTKVLARVMTWLDERGIRMPPEPVFVDVGANIGTTTVSALRRFDFASGVAIEPEPENFRLLRANLVMNDLDERVRALPVAASGAEGEVLLEVARRKSGIHHVVDAADPERRTLGVEAVTLDGLVERGVIEPARVGLLWVDVVGHEEAVLAGATALLTQGIPLVTAYRPGLGIDRSWPAQPVLELLTSHYTEVAELRRLRSGQPTAQLATLVAALRSPTDLLFVNR
jgi:FkbM family methyltransferase